MRAPLRGWPPILCGLELLRNRRNAKVQQLARALSADFTPAESDQLAAVAPLLELLAQSI